jgi:3-oxoadipate enol-lactonase
MRLSYSFEGPAEAPVLVLPGALGTTRAIWDAQIGALTSSFRLLLYDQRGHGGSQAPPGPYTIEALAHDLLDLLDRLALARVSICGISLGGAVAMWLAAEAPERVERLVLVSTAARFGARRRYVERARMVRADGMEAIVDAALERWLTPTFRGQNREIVERLRRGSLTTDPEAYAACCEAMAQWDFSGRLRSIQQPTLVVYGEKDLSTPLEDSDLLASWIPSAQLVEVPLASHLPNVERPNLFNPVVLDHLTTARDSR